MNRYLDFEKDIENIEKLITELDINKNNFKSENAKLLDKKNNLFQKIYSNLSAWDKVQVARHPDRPQFQDVIEHLIEGYLSLGGDRLFGNDNALTGGVGYFRGKKVLLLGIDKGKNTNDRILRNFGMARPEGYRKAIRLMELANRFNLPVLSFIDTAGAYPGKGAEERGQAQAIASCVDACLKLNTPMISTILGEGGSGGAIALTSGNVILMFEHSIFSVISPEGCASILWRDASKANEAAKALKLTAKDMKKLNIIDEIIQEPLGGAHRDYDKSLKLLGDSIELQLNELLKLDRQELKLIKQNKYLKIT